ncbi:MAG: ATP-binding cassette domain-containing protein [Rhodospirillaceae bacterium]|nr:ATP-binding cassette domain-containing protein [Rhodospirillaceae bacterium]
MSKPQSDNAPLPRLRPMRGLRMEMLAVSSAMNLLSLALPIVILQVYDRVIPNAANQTLVVFVFALGAVLIIDAILSYGRSSVTGWGGARTQHYLACAALRRLFKTDLRSFEAVAPGVHMQRLRAVDGIKTFYAGQGLLLMVDLPFAAVFLLLIGLIAGKLVFVPAAILVLLSIFALFSGRALSESLKSRAIGDERRHNFMIEVLSNIHTVKALGMEALMVRRHERLQSSSAEASYQVSLAGATARNLGMTLSQVPAVAVGAFGSTLVMDGTLTMGGLAASTMLASRAAQPMLRSLGIWTQFQNAQVARRQFDEMFALPQEARTDDSTEVSFEDPIIIKDLNFGYTEDKEPVYRDLDLRIEYGEIIGIAGANGSGKSTFLGLMMGALVPAEGQGHVMIGDTDIWRTDAAALRRHVCYLPQNAVLFQGTIMDNLTMFGGQHYVDRAMYFADRLGLHEAIGKMPKGYDTPVEYRKTTRIPGGVRQRIALVRALTMTEEPRLILFDEAYVQLDRSSDEKLHTLLREYVGKCTMVIVSHRPSYMNLADRVLVVRNGELIPASGGARESIEKLQKEYA